jgi:thiosulfate/3-mercaptopyruvate sulfurtransferase
MPFTTLIGVEELRDLLARKADLVIVDCGFDLTDTEAGHWAYEAGHLPGALYAHLDRDLAGPLHPKGARSAEFTGRHPLPDRADFARRVGSWGIGAQTQVVFYDDQGAPYAARAWWMLKWLGHQAVAVLDGGRTAWMKAGGPLDHTAHEAQPGPPYPMSAQPAMPTIETPALLRALGRVRLFDARNLDRWRGAAEHLDPVAGHVPGALPRFFKDNLQPDGRFKPADELRGAFAALGAAAGAPVVHQCGSGVTACQNVLAMAHAGLDAGMLHAGSWSEWCADASRPVARA